MKKSAPVSLSAGNSSSTPSVRLERVLSTLTPAPQETRSILGHLTLSSISTPIYTSLTPTRLPYSPTTLPLTNSTTTSHLFWLLQKYTLGQDVFLISPPGPYSRRLAYTFAKMCNKEIEYVALHRDVGEGELKQSREIRAGGKLEWVDGAAVRAVKEGRLLLLDGIERCERGVLPILNNLLENRELNLEDGTHIVSADRYDLMISKGEDITNFIPAHRDFRVIAIGLSVPPYPGFPLDPPFRSRFQSRYLDPLSTSLVLSTSSTSSSLTPEAQEILTKTQEAIVALQIKREMLEKMGSGVVSTVKEEEIPGFGQTGLWKLKECLALFPPSTSTISEVQRVSQFKSLLLVINPALSFMNSVGWRALERAFSEEEGTGLEAWTKGISEIDRLDGILPFINEAGRPEGGEVQLGAGIMGWRISTISRISPATAQLTFLRGPADESTTIIVPCGPHPFLPLPLTASPSLLLTPRFHHLLTSLLQLHSLKTFDITFVPTSASGSEGLMSSTGSSLLLIETFAKVLGYEFESVHLYKELSGREIWMRRVVNDGLPSASSSQKQLFATSSTSAEKGTTTWSPSPLIKGAWEGKLIHLEGIDTIGNLVGSLGRLMGEREGELWEGRRLVGLEEGERLSEGEKSAGLSQAHPSFRIIATSSKSTAPRVWLNEELSSLFISLPSIPMSLQEEKSLLLSTGCPLPLIDTLETFARAYRAANSGVGNKSRRLGTGALLRICQRLSQYPEEGLWEILNRTLLSEFLPSTKKGELVALLGECGIKEGANYWNPPAVLESTALVFPASSDPQGRTSSYSIPLYDISQDEDGASHVPYMNNYLDNSQQTRLMRDIATDLEVLGQHVLLMGTQGVGKNKIIDRVLQLLKRPREFIQLHRDSTTQSLMFQTALEGGVIRYIDSPLLRAVKLGRIIVVDEVDKASPAVVAGLASLAARGEMTLADGRRIRPPGLYAQEGDIVVNPGFRIILLANKPGYPFLGNAFLRVVGDSFSTYSVSNPDPQSEERILTQLAPDLSTDLLKSLIGAFADLRTAFEAGTLSYPFSLRELLALIRHMKRFPEDSLEQVLRNVFDFDVNRPETLDTLYDILRKHKLGVERLGIDAVRVGTEVKEKGVVVEFKPTGDTSLDEPKYGKTDDKKHTGGNTWAGGTGGRDTAGLGGRGGYMRLYKGGDISQISDELKADVPDEIKNKARDMARKELAARLAEIDLTSGQSATYSGYHDAVLSHVNQLVTFLDNLEANEEERVWLKRQSDGELDESRLTEGLTGEAAIYKRRGMEKPELGRPQIKPKRIRFIFDLSASMYRNQYDGRLTRSLETAVMVLESFSRLQRKEKYRVDIVGQSGEEAVIPLVPLDTIQLMHAGDRYKVIQKMAVIPQYTWAGDHTLEAIIAGVTSVADSDSDDFFVVVITDANFERYGIKAEDLKRSMDGNAKVKCAMIAIGEGAEAEWLPKALPGRAYRVKETSDIATTLRAILGSMLNGEM